MENKKIIIILIAIIAIITVSAVGGIMVLNNGNLTLDTDAYVVSSSMNTVNEHNYTDTDLNITYDIKNSTNIYLRIGNLENGPYSAEFIYYDSNGKQLSKETISAVGGSSQTERSFSSNIETHNLDHINFKIFDRGNMVFNGTISK
ncbi:hypothetical protein [Methanobrevibacter arboriphilus]|uniref:Uncharacterized protein n=1 Tax=Methanobrevibacter arboriphilus TaxID=39441 RepID=A0ACA8R2J1_METAZ|nr:hypothetical protein [Methanobrevibacter arboriphilus]BBL61502.1 hypothetical protein MarbSA_05420 [Methanobrevibacter arboriphilus]